MLHLTDAGKVWSVVIFVSEAATTLIGFSIVLLVLFQLNRKNISFIVLMLDISIFGLMCCISDLGGHFYPPILIPAFNITALVVAVLPTAVLNFLMEYLNIWTRQRRIVFWIEVVYLLLIIVLAIKNQLWISVQYLSDGTYTSTYYSTSALLLVAGEISYFYTFGILVAHYIKQRATVDRMFFIGFVFIHLTGFSYLIPTLPPISIGTDFLTIASLILIGPVMRQRLFDPLSQLNQRLTRRTVLLKKISLVGQNIILALDFNLDALLTTTVHNIQVIFGYSRVSLYLPKENNLVMAYAEPQFDSLPFEKKFEIDRDDSSVSRAFQNGSIVFEKDSNCVMIAIVGNDKRSVGVLVICATDIFSEDEQDVFQLLGQSISAAIHNAMLFEQVQKARETADNANKAKTQFLSMMSHDLRTPLQTILLGSQFLGQLEPGVTLNQSDHTDIRHIRDASLDMKQLIDKILDLSRIEAGQIDLDCKSFDFASSIRRVKDAMSSLLQPGVDISIDLKESVFHFIYADEIKFREILTNLVSNSCKFCKFGHISITAQVQDSMILFSVIDTGPGIPEDLHSILFNPFTQERTSSRHHGGSGLGLSICKLLVNLQGGKIWFESKKGEGSTFYFTLPIATVDTQQVTYLDENEDKMPFYIDIGSDIPLQIIFLGEKNFNYESLTSLLSTQGYELLYLKTPPSQATAFVTILEPRLVVVVHKLGDLWSDWIASLPLQDIANTVIIDYPDHQTIDGIVGSLSIIEKARQVTIG